MMPLRVHDTRRREKVDFTTMNPGIVNMYVCGVTVYDLCHLGHALLLVIRSNSSLVRSPDTMSTMFQNFTDIDDKIINRANETGEDWRELVENNNATYYRDMDALNILRADSYPRCTEYVDDMIRITQDLIDKGNAYAADDGVYFSVESAPEKYGQLTGQNIDAVRSGAEEGSMELDLEREITRTSLFGKQQSLESLLGILLGGQVDQDGTSSVQR